MRFLTAATAIVSLALSSAALAAPSTFAQYSQLGGADTVRLTNGAGSTGTLIDINDPTVIFNFLLPELISAGLASQSAVFELSGLISQPASVTVQPGPDPLNQLIDSGTIRFTRTTAAGIGTGSRTNLLTIQFTDALLTGFVNGTSGSVLASTPDSTLYFTSDFLDFTGVQSLDFALALSSITPGLARAGAFESASAFTADSTGTFSSDPAPGVNGVPEPGMLGLLGMGFAGLALTRRRKAA